MQNACSSSDKQQRKQMAFEQFLKADVKERTSMLSQAAQENPVGGSRDPHLHLAWNEAAFAQARGQGGPFTDAAGNPDPRTVASAEQILVNNGAETVSWGLFKFKDADAIHTALLQLRNTLPWMARSHPSHATSGDVVLECVHVNAVKKGVLAHESLRYFEMV